MASKAAVASDALSDDEMLAIARRISLETYSVEQERARVAVAAEEPIEVRLAELVDTLREVMDEEYYVIPDGLTVREQLALLEEMTGTKVEELSPVRSDREFVEDYLGVDVERVPAAAASAIPTPPPPAAPPTPTPAAAATPPPPASTPTPKRASRPKKKKQTANTKPDAERPLPVGLQHREESPAAAAAAATPRGESPEALDDDLRRAMELSLDPRQQESERKKREEEEMLRKAIEESMRISEARPPSPTPPQPPRAAEVATLEGLHPSASSPGMLNGDDGHHFPGLTNAIAASIDDEKERRLMEHSASMASLRYESNHVSRAPGTPRPIVIDGNNVAFNHGNQQGFSAKGLSIALLYFLNRGHKDVTIFCKMNRHISAEDLQVCEELKRFGYLTMIESGGYYDDLALLDAAKRKGAIVVSNDKFRDILAHSEFGPRFREQIERRRISYWFVANHDSRDTFGLPLDPVPRTPVTLDQFLSF